MLYGAVRAVLPKMKAGVATNALEFMNSGAFDGCVEVGARDSAAPSAIDARWASEGGIVGGHAGACRR